MADTEKKKTFLEVLWEILQTAGLGLGILAIKGSIETAFAETGKKAGEKIGEKIGEVTGLSSDEAKKTDADEISLCKVYAKGDLTDTEKKQARTWIRELRRVNPELASEFTRRIHNILIELTIQKEIKSGKQAKNEVNDSDGIKVAVSLIRDILNAPNDNARLELLEDENIKVTPPKPTPEFVKKAKEAEEKNRGELEKTSSDWRERAKKWRDNK